MNSNDTQDKLDALRLSYIATLNDKRSTIKENWQQLVNQWNPEHFDALYIVLHGLAGSAETFGLPKITSEARELVDTLKLLSKSGAPDQTDLSQLDRSINAFLAHLEMAGGR